MRKIFKKFILAAIAGTMIFSGGAIAMAATESEIAAETANVGYPMINANVNSEDEGGTSFSINTNVCKLEVVVNGIIAETFYNDKYGGEYYDECWKDYYLSVHPGYTYNVEFRGYDDTDNKTVTKTYKRTVAMPSIAEIELNMSCGTYYSDGKTTGYSMPAVNIAATANIGFQTGMAEIVIERSVGNKNSFKELKRVTSNGSYDGVDDYNLEPGKKYYYRAKYISIPDEYNKKVVSSSYVYSDVLDVSKLETKFSLEYVNGGIQINMHDYYYSGSFEIYRSTNKKKGYKLITHTSDTGYLDKDVKAGKTYYYKVKPVFMDQSTKKVYKGSMTKPMGAKLIIGEIYVDAKEIAKNKISYKWGKVPGANSYEVWVKSNEFAGTGFKKVTTTNSTKYVLKGLVKGCSYEVRIKACVKSGGVIKFYNAATNYYYVGLHQPYNVTPGKITTTVSGNKMTIATAYSWDRVYHAKGYIVYGYDSEKSKNVVLKKITNNKTTKFTAANVCTVDNEGYSKWKYSSISISAYDAKDETYAVDTTDSMYLAPVKGLKIKKKTATSAALTWKAVQCANEYYVYRYAPTGEDVCIGVTSSLSFVDDCLTPGVNYTYNILAGNTKFYVNSNYYYDNSKVYNHSSSAPVISGAKNSGKKKVTVTWKPASGAVKYIVYRSTNKKKGFVQVGTAKAGSTSYTDKKVKKGKTYYYKISACITNDAGVAYPSAQSGVKSVKVKK